MPGALSKTEMETRLSSSVSQRGSNTNFPQEKITYDKHRGALLSSLSPSRVCTKQERRARKWVGTLY